MPLPSSAKPVRVCDNCHPLLLQRYSSTGNWGPSAVWSVSTMSECNGYHVVMTGPQDVQTLFVTATPQISNGLIKVSPQFFLNKIWCNFPFCGHYKHIPLHSSTCTDGGSSLHDKHSWTCPCIVLLQLSLSLEIV